MTEVQKMHATTIVSVRRGGQVAVAGDGQVSFGETILKSNATKIRLLYKDSVLAGFAGATADAFTLLERFEGKLEKHNGQLDRSAVELAKDWRTDRVLRNLQAMMAVADKKTSLLITGDGNVVEPEGDDSLISIGSGGVYAQAAARALLDNTDLDAREIVTRSLKIAAGICIYTNDQVQVQTLTAV